MRVFNGCTVVTQLLLQSIVVTIFLLQCLLQQYSHPTDAALAFFRTSQCCPGNYRRNILYHYHRHPSPPPIRSLYHTTVMTMTMTMTRTAAAAAVANGVIHAAMTMGTDEFYNDDGDVHNDRSHRPTATTNHSLLILGMGRLGVHVAHYAKSNSTTNGGTVCTRICGTVRNRSTVTQTPPLLLLDPDDDDNHNNSNNSIDTTTTTIISWDDVERILYEARRCTHLFITIPPNGNRTIQEQLNRRYDQLLQDIFISNSNSTSSNNPQCTWIGIVSTTGVYGNHHGRWVTEESGTVVLNDDDDDDDGIQPSTSSNNADNNWSSLSSSQRYVIDERMWQRRIENAMATIRNGPCCTNHPTHSNVTLCIFRCAGIYSTDQSALHTIYKNGYKNDTITTTTSTATLSSIPIKNRTDITNRIHVNDIAAAVVAAIPQPQQQQINHTSTATSTTPTNTVCIYNLADDLPESRAVVMQYAYQLFQQHHIHVPSTTQSRPPIHSNTTTSIAAAIPNNNNTMSFHSNIKDTNRSERRRTDQKRIDNTKMKRELLPNGLQFPTYIDGLKDILDYRNNPWW
jgi:hypothetical protein